MAEKEKDDTTSSKGEDSEPWGTLEELLLASAVNRHGIHNSWNSIADELHTRTHKTFSPLTCEHRYVDLTRRFHGGSGESDVALIEELRKIRVEELKREVHRHDVSIVSLQLKVKRLEVERESKGEPDLMTGNATGAYVELVRSSPEKVDSVEAGRSFNESNSAEDVKAKIEPGPVQLRSNNEPIINDGGSSRPGELGVCVRESAQQEQSSDVQSSASLSKKKRRRLRCGGSSGDEVSPAYERIDVKSQPLIRFLEILRSHNHGCIFKCRLSTQETENYGNVIRQHMDLDTVQSRIEKGVYSEYYPKFYRDLLLIFTNAVMFYRKSSPEHLAARELQKMVIDEVVQRTQKPIKSDPDPQNLEPVVKKPRSSTAMVVCRRRSSSSMQAVSEIMKKNDEHSNNNYNRNNTSNENVEVKSNSKSSSNKVERSKGDLPPKKVVSGGSSKESEKKALMRETSVLGQGGGVLSKKMTEGEGSKPEELAVKKSNHSDQKTPQEKGTNSSKKQGVANFLKRMKQNSPSSQEKAAEEKPESTKKRGNSSSTREVVSRRKGREEKDVPMVTRRSGNNGRPPKRKAAMVSTPDSGKGGRSKKKTRR